MAVRSFPRWRFGLRALFAFIIAASLAAAFAASAWHRGEARRARELAEQRRVRAEAAMIKLGGEFSWHVGPFAPPGTMNCMPTGPGNHGLDLKSTKITNGELVLLRDIPDLEKLNLASTAIDDRGLSHLLGLRRLTGLALSKTGVTDKGIAQLTSLTNLRILYLGHTPVTLKAVENLEKKLPNLHVLSYEPWQPVNGPFADFGQVLISGQQTVSGMLQPLVAAGEAGNIREVRIRGVKLAAGDIAQIAQLPSLRRLTLQDTRFDRERLEPLARAIGLEELDLSGSPLVSADAAPISKLAKLRRLRLCCIQIGDAGVEHLRSLTELELLDLSRSQVTNRALTIISRFRRLQDLYLYDTKVTGDGLREVGKLAHLKKLGLPLGLFGADFQHLRKLTSLEEIYLNQVVGMDEAVANLANCVKLKALNLAFSDLSDMGMKTVAGFHALTFITLARTKVTDDGISALEHLSNLEYIDASETSVGDDGLTHLTRLSELTALHLLRTRVTDAGLIHLRGLSRLRTLEVPRICEWGTNANLLRSEHPELMLFGGG